MPDDETRGAEPAKGQAASDAELSARLKRLDAKLDRVRESETVQGSAREQVDAEPSALGRALRLSTEFIAGVIAGFGIGWLLDRWLGTSPWGLIVFLMLGFGAGVFNAMRGAGFLRSASGGGSGTGSA